MLTILRHFLKKSYMLQIFIFLTSAEHLNSFKFQYKTISKCKMLTRSAIVTWKVTKRKKKRKEFLKSYNQRRLLMFKENVLWVFSASDMWNFSWQLARIDRSLRNIHMKVQKTGKSLLLYASILILFSSISSLSRHLSFSLLTKISKWKQCIANAPCI